MKKKKVKVRFLKDGTLEKKGDEVWIEQGAVDMYLKDGNGLIELIEEEKIEQTVKESIKKTMELNEKEKGQNVYFPENKELFDMVSKKIFADAKKTPEQKIEEARELLRECYNLVQEVIEDYVDIPLETKKFLALWIIGTYFHNEFSTYPILFLNAMRSSAKTRTLKLIASMSNGGNGFIMNNLSEASLFRHPKNNILCIDEIESLGGKDKQTLRELLNSCYKKGTQVVRVKKVKQDGQEQYEREYHELYFPVALANIWGIEEVLESRAVTLILEKSDNPYYTKKIEDFENNLKIARIKAIMPQISEVLCSFMSKKRYIVSAWHDWINTHYSSNKTTHNNIYTLNTYNNTDYTEGLLTQDKRFLEELFSKIDASGINGRMLELYFPLIITTLDLNELDEFLEIAKNNVKNKQEEEFAESKDVTLFEYIANHGKSNEYVPIKEMTSHFRLFAGDTGRDEENWVNEKWMGRALKRLNLIGKKRREASGMFVIVDVEKARCKIKMFKRREDE